MEAEFVIGLADLLESLFCFGLFCEGEVILTRQFSVGCLDLVLAGIPINAQGGVVIRDLH
jgi:hypothetical protein